jgi:hypothetical protein
MNDFRLHLVYRRPPNAPAESINELVRLVNGTNRNNKMIGDFYLPSIDWERDEARGKASEFCEAVKDLAIKKLVDFPTHKKGTVFWTWL